jgi:tetratricopeptide (TPR) repeat protein
LLTARGEELFDSTALDGQSLGFFDPRGEFSGTVSFDVLPWSRCQEPEGSTALPLLASNDPWYFSILGFHHPTQGSGVSFAFSGRVVSVAASQVPGEPVVYGVVAGNHELLHTSAFAIIPAEPFSGANPPRMVDQTFEENGLRSYTLLEADHKTYGVNAVVAEPDGSWRVCTPDDRCEAIDRFGNRAAVRRDNAGADPETLWRDRMERFRRLSEVDLSRRRGAYEAADEGYRALAAGPFGDSVEEAALHLVGARIAAALGDLRAVVRRSTRSQELWDVTEDAALVRAEARIVAGQHEDAMRDLHAAQGQRAATIYNVTKWRFFSAWLNGEHVLAERLCDEIDFPVLKARLRGFVLIENGLPARALSLLDPWAGHFVRERVQLLRALALVDLGRIDEARRALEAEVDRHPWLRGEADAISLAADLAERRPVDPERASAILVETERRGRRDMEARMLVARVRIEVADALLRAEHTLEARAVLDGVSADHSGTALLARARRLRESLSGPPE